jgi:uracil-DNA glycosylase
MWEVDKTWDVFLNQEMRKDYFATLQIFLRNEIESGKIVYPKEADFLKAFTLTSFSNLKVVIIGQDPYHGPNQAHGLAFSVNKEVKIPPSLKNIFKELQSDLNLEIPKHGNLQSWAQQGVLLLNASLSVVAAKPMSHAKCGWYIFTDEVIKYISAQKKNVVFLLWGSFAQQKTSLIDLDKHLILQAPHPSPLSAYHGFFGCKHFSKINVYLQQQGLPIINWQLAND